MKFGYFGKHVLRFQFMRLDDFIFFLSLVPFTLFMGHEQCNQIYEQYFQV